MVSLAIQQKTESIGLDYAIFPQFVTCVTRWMRAMCEAISILMENIYKESNRGEAIVLAMTAFVKKGGNN